MTQMQLGTQTELEVLRTAVVAGIFMGVIYGLLAVVRKSSESAAVQFFCDFAYALMFGAAFFVFSLDSTGYLRGFVLVGMIFGAVCWHFAVGRFISAFFCRAVGCAVGFITKTAAWLGGKFVKNNTNLKKDENLSENHLKV